MLRLSSAALLLALASSSLAAQCFYPAGNPAKSDVPCNPNAAVSPCCASANQCLSNGLCRVNSDPNTVQFARGSCTDSSWGSGCFSQCHKTSYPGNPVTNGASVYACNSTGWTNPAGASYCCETDVDQGTGCCDGGKTFWLPPGAAAAVKPAPVFLAVSSSTSSSSSVAASTTSSSSSSSASATAASSSSSSSSLSSSSSCTSTYSASSLPVLGNATSTYIPSTSASAGVTPVSNGTVVSTAGPTVPAASASATGAATQLHLSMGGVFVVGLASVWIML